MYSAAAHGTTLIDAEVIPLDDAEEKLGAARYADLLEELELVEVAGRGIHQLWPKCPKGNLDISPGRVEAYVSPPMLGETTLLPKRRSLRIQMETAALFQAIQITTLLDPGPSGSE